MCWWQFIRSSSRHSVAWVPPMTVGSTTKPCEVFWAPLNDHYGRTQCHGALLYGGQSVAQCSHCDNSSWDVLISAITSVGKEASMSQDESFPHPLVTCLVCSRHCAQAASMSQLYSNASLTKHFILSFVNDGFFFFLDVARSQHASSPRASLVDCKNAHENLKAKISKHRGRFQFVIVAQSVGMDKRSLFTDWSSKKCPKPVRKFLKELKREVLWTMLRFPYCSTMEPALKQCLDPLTLPANPSDQSNGHLKHQYLLLLTMWLLWCKALTAKPFPGTWKINNFHD